MSWLNYHHLLYFWKVAQTGSVTAAAKELRLAHPTISSQIRTLERNFGHKLFRQVGRRLQLTETGQLVYRYANDIFSLGEELQQAVEGRPASGGISLKVGVTDVLPKPIAYQFLEPALKLPGVHAVIYEGKPDDLMTQLVVHELDLVLSDFPLGPQFTLNAATPWARLASTHASRKAPPCSASNRTAPANTPPASPSPIAARRWSA